jgi:hypothetical protein
LLGGLNLKTALGADESAENRGADGDARAPRRTRECIEPLSKSSDAREVALNLGRQARVFRSNILTEM